MKIYFIGIGGIGISALAQYYLAKGHEVSGSDLVSSEMTDFLKKKGVKIIIGKHKTENLSKDVDLVIYSPAVPSDNPELKRALELQVKGYRSQVLSYPQALGELTKKYFTIAVAGTHGKSTVTAMLGLILVKAGLNPTVILGTKLKEFGQSNFRMGKSTPHQNKFGTGQEYLVIEADEWQASFLNYWPKIIVLTNIEREHLDYYRDMEHILRTYREFISNLPENGTLVINPKSKYQISNQIQNPNFKIQNFSLKQREVEKLRKILKIAGKHNVLNALAALTAARVLKVPDKISFKALAEYKGAWRRFETTEVDIREHQRRIRRKITIISDYAHHPTEIAVTLKASRQKYPKRKLCCIFQPHQYQRTFYLFQDFVRVFKEAFSQKWIDKLVITDIYDVVGRETKNIKIKISSGKLIKAINKSWAIYLPKTKIINYLKKNLNGGEVIIIMGAGDIYEIIRELK